MSKFRNKKSTVKVTGKLPSRALYTPLYCLHTSFPELNEHERNNRSKHLHECDGLYREFFYRSQGDVENCFISLVNTKDITVSVVKDSDGGNKGLVLSLGYIVNVSNLLLSKGVRSAMALKLIDLCRYVAEGDASVVECKISGSVRNHHGYGYRSHDDFRGKLIPWLSKRFDKTTFYNHAVETYPNEKDFLARFADDLDFFRYGKLPQSVIASEIIIFREEWKSGALTNA